MQTVVVTGASSGIGEAAVRMLIRQGFRVMGSVRTLADAERLQAGLGTNFVPLNFDVTDSAAVRAAASAVANELDGKPLFGLVNNAGIALPGPLLYIDIDDFRRQIDVNVSGQLIVTQAFAPLLMDERRTSAPGRIVIISSISGTSSTPFVGPYNASKFAIEGFSECLRRELMIFGIDVVVVAPGAVATPIWDKVDAIDTSRYDNTAYAAAIAKVKSYMIEAGKKGYDPDRIGETIFLALTSRRPKTRYVVTPDRLQYHLLNFLPKRVVDRLIGRQIGLLRPES